MFRILFVLFVVIPIIEIAVLMQVGELIGAWPTVAIVIITAWLGAKNVRQQGLATVQNLQTKMASGQMPSKEIVAGLLLLVAGVLLVTPGFVTDAFGLSLLIPQVRLALVKSVQQHLTVHAANSNSFTYSAHFTETQQQSPFNDEKLNKSKPNIHQGDTIEGEFERKD
ncbi:FxsA family protein [Colwellia sp. MEBiC06753]